MKTALYPRDIAEQIYSLNSHIERLSKQLHAKDSRIAELESKVRTLEEHTDKHEQYTRRPNITFHGITERSEGEDTDTIVLDVINNKMGVTPPLVKCVIERSHRLSAKRETGCRSIIVRFRAERTRDKVFSERFTLKGHNSRNRSAQIFVNEDLTRRRTMLVYESRKLKQQKKITDCWTTNAKIMIKDLNNRIKEITYVNDLQLY